jgi:dienelactone hydrolase
VSKSAAFHSALALLFVLTAMIADASAAQGPPQERTLQEIKTEALARAKTGMYPMIGLDAGDVSQAFERIKTKNPDEWAAAFDAVADRYMAQAKALEASDREKANAAYLRAWRLYYFGNWPVPISTGKLRSYNKSLEAFVAHGRLLDPPIQVVHIPFEGKEIVGYLRLPKDAKGPVPMVIAINGADSRKENMSLNFDAAIPHGIGYLAVDTPGTGQAPIKAGPTADRLYSRVIDWLLTQPQMDKTRIAAEGQSWGAYWATKLAIVERARLKCVVAQSPGVHAGYVHGLHEDEMLRNREYLFGLAQVFQYLYGVKTIAEANKISPQMSLVNQHLIGKPTTPMLIIAGVKDTLIPMSDIYLILDNGDIPKDAWINPQGGHLGRQVGVWPDPVIFNKVIIPWLIRHLDMPTAQ